MSDFRIIKCPKCDAALVEMADEKLNKCVQCKHNFSFGSGAKNKKRKSISKIGLSNNEKAPNFKELLNQLKQMKKSDLSNKQNFPSHESSSIHQSRVKIAKAKNKTKVQPPKKKKSFSIGSIIFWIIAFNIVLNIIRGIMES